MPTRKEILQTKIDTDLATATSITATEHRGVESAIMNAAIPANRGFFTGLDVQGTPVGTNLSVGGDITAAVVISQENFSGISVYFATSMITTNYIVRIHVQSAGSDQESDTSIFCPTFRVISPTNIYINIREQGGFQNLRVHLEVVSLDY
jgi:hypothetical protein